MLRHRLLITWPWKSAVLSLSLALFVWLVLGVSSMRDLLYLTFFSSFFFIINKPLENRGKRMLIPAYFLSLSALFLLQEEKSLSPVIWIASIELFWRTVPKLKNTFIGMKLFPDVFRRAVDSSRLLLHRNSFRERTIGILVLLALISSLRSTTISMAELIFLIFLLPVFFSLMKLFRLNQMVSPNIRIPESPMSFREERKDSAILVLILGFCLGTSNTTIYVVITYYCLLLMSQKYTNRLHSLATFFSFSLQVLTFYIIQVTETETVYFYLFPTFVLMAHFPKSK